MAEKLVVDSRGTERTVRPNERTIFESKKASIVDEESILRHLGEAQRLAKEMEVGQKEASVVLHPEYPDLPVFIWLLCDSHLGSVQVNYDRFLKDYNLVKDTPNFYVLSNGDEIDHFMVHQSKTSTGVYENPITPQQQARLFRKLFKDLDNQGKVLGMTFGNHNQWLSSSGYNFEGTWLSDFKCPILNCGGRFNIDYEGQEYRVGATHKFWGSSKLNPTNAAKRYLEHVDETLDVIFLAHTHQAEFLFFRRGNEVAYRYAIIGGTYKESDTWAAQVGIAGTRGQQGGFVLKLKPGERDIEILRTVPEAEEYFQLLKGINERKR